MSIDVSYVSNDWDSMLSTNGECGPKVKRLIDLEALPFYIAAEASPSRQDFPDQLPFVLGYDSDLGLLIQMPNQETERALELVYRSKAPLGTPMHAEGLGRRYADNFFEFIDRRVTPNGLAKRNLLEVGSGTGYLLSRLDQAEANVIGVEPGPGCEELATSTRITILTEYLKNCTFDHPFDLIVHFAVAEHIADPMNFFMHQRGLLGEKGQILFAVPDCTDLYERGDLSYLAHEHWSYFTPTALTKLARMTGFVEKYSEKSSFGGMIYCQWEIDELSREALPTFDEFAGFSQMVEKGLAALQDYFENQFSNQSSVGVFCGARLQNYHSMLNLAGKRVRLFDDDPHLTGRYYPPIDIAIEARSTLLADPVDNILVFSRAFGGAIAASLRQHAELKTTPITVIGDLF